MEISKVWFKQVFTDYVISHYGSLDVLKQYDSIRDNKIGDHMCQEVRKQYKPPFEETAKWGKASRKLCNELIKEIRI